MLERDLLRRLLNNYLRFIPQIASKSDFKVEHGDIISARGYGKFIIRSVSEVTKKGRLRLFADKYI